MNEAIFISLITSAITVTGTLIGVYFQNSKTQAVIETKLEILTKSVEKHNGFATKIPVIEEQIKVANHRIDDLERKTV